MNFVVVFESPDRQECMEMRLVLAAAGVPAKVSTEASCWSLFVPEGQLAAAHAELTAYKEDNTDERKANPAAQQLNQPRGTIEGIFGYSVIIMFCASFSWYTLGGEHAQEVGHLHAGSVLAGQWWRNVTALTLHLDFGHLLSNLIFGAVFGSMAGKMLGGGVAWLLILLGGASGNFANALIRDSSHHSLGASTAVFSALGIAVAYALRPSLSSGQQAMQRWKPLIAGVLLLAFLGTGGERTDVDVTAHVTGFLAGLAGGWMASHLPGQWLCNAKLQWSAAALAVGIVGLAWYAALSFSG